MKYRHKQLIGRILKSIGLIMMLGGILLIVIAQHPELDFLTIFNTGSLGIMFVGALVWLFGAHIGAKKCIVERYWWSRNYEK